jgi:hypothetical protein
MSKIHKKVIEADEHGEITRQYTTTIDNSKVCINQGKGFIKVFTHELMKLRGSMNSTDVIVSTILMHFISYESGMLTKTSKNDERYPLLNKDIQEITGLSEKATLKTMNRLVKIGVYAKAKHKRSFKYFANPYIFMRGSKINRTLKDMFKEYQD